jgi:hypothetical protein
LGDLLSEDERAALPARLVVFAHNRRRYLFTCECGSPSARIMSDLAPVASFFLTQNEATAEQENQFLRARKIRRVYFGHWSVDTRQEEFAPTERKIEITSICVCALTELETSFIAAPKRVRRERADLFPSASFSRRAWPLSKLQWIIH